MKDMEQVLLSNTSLDELIKMKIEQEFKKPRKPQKSAPKTISVLKDVPKEKIFTKDAVFRVYNRKNGTETFINGIQADAMIGAQDSVREQILNKTLSAFSTDDAYIKFEKAKI